MPRLGLGGGVGRRRWWNSGGGVGQLILTQGGVQVTSLAGPVGQAFQIDGAYLSSAPGTDILAQLVFASLDSTIAFIDAPSLTSTSPATIVQGTNAVYTFTGSNIQGNETIGGLPTGLTASAYAYTPTTVTCTLTASNSVVTGAWYPYLICNRGRSKIQLLTVNVGISSPPLTGLVRRYVASSGTNTTVNGATITSWTDTIAGKVLSVSGTPGLQYVSSALSGRPGIKATNGPGYFIESAFDSAINTAATTVVIIYEHTGTTETGEHPFFSLRSATSNGLCIEYPSNMDIIGRTGTGSAQTSVGAFTVDAGAQFHTVMLTASTAASQSALYIDNVQSGSTVSAAYSPNAATAFSIFADAAIAATLQGTICEVLIYDHVFSSTERTDLATNYISPTYGI